LPNHPLGFGKDEKMGKKWVRNTQKKEGMPSA
jgi:hypothetical protein